MTAGPPLPALLSLVAGALLLGDALYLMRRGLFSLGVTLPFALGCGLLALGGWWTPVQDFLSASAGRRTAWRAGWALFWLWLASVAAFWLVLGRAANPAAGERAGAGAPPRALLVLGSGTPRDTVSPTLAARLDLALARAAVFPQATVVVSGGPSFGGKLSEGRIMGDYLRARGLDAGRILQEEDSTSTEENLVFSRRLLGLHGVDAGAPVEIVTSDFHVLRARWIARGAGWRRVSAFGAPMPLYLRYNAWLREYFAVLSGFLLREFQFPETRKCSRKS